jgi:hypothetical protein
MTDFEAARTFHRHVAPRPSSSLPPFVLSEVEGQATSDIACHMCFDVAQHEREKSGR